MILWNGLMTDKLPEEMGIIPNILEETLIMDDSDKILSQIIEAALSVTEMEYYCKIQEGYTLLVKLRDLGAEKEVIFQSLTQYYDTLKEGISRDYIADVLDFVVGWCAPQYEIWRKESISTNFDETT